MSSSPKGNPRPAPAAALGSNPRNQATAAKPPFRDFGSIEALSYALDPVHSSPKVDPRAAAAISSPLSQPAPSITAKPPFRDFGSIEALSYALEPVSRSPKGPTRSPAAAVASPLTRSTPPIYR